MSKLFEKAAFFTDIHFGLSGDSETHNQDCIRFMTWFCDNVRDAQCDSVFFLGDWFHNQTKIRKDTNSYSNQALKMLDSLGVPVYMLVGNHDMYFKTSREHHSLLHVDRFPNIHLVEDFVVKDGVLMTPYLVTDEHVIIPNHEEVTYIFGHFALPGFLANETYEFPNKGGITAESFMACKAVYTGHFHKRQTKNSKLGIPVTYIGNCFPHNYNDVHDRKRGFMILEWGDEPTFFDWTEAPNYNRVKLSMLMEMIDEDNFTDTFNQWSVVEVYDDMGIEPSEALELKETLQEYVRDLKVRPKVDELDGSQEVDFDESDFQTADEMVVGYLDKLDTEGSEYDVELLKELYEGAEVVG